MSVAAEMAWVGSSVSCCDGRARAHVEAGRQLTPVRERDMVRDPEGGAGGIRDRVRVPLVRDGLAAEPHENARRDASEGVEGQAHPHDPLQSRHGLPLDLENQERGAPFSEDQRDLADADRDDDIEARLHGVGNRDTAHGLPDAVHHRAVREALGHTGQYLAILRQRCWRLRPGGEGAAVPVRRA